MTEFKDWYDGLPMFTKYWLTLTLGFSLFGRFGILKYPHLVLDFDSFFYDFQIWRPVTALFYYPITPGTGFHFLINCYFLYSYSLRLETGMFAGKPADYLTLLLFNWFCCVTVGLLANIPVSCYFLYSYSLRLETGMFAGKPADYLTLLLFNWFCCVTVGLLANIPVLMDPMVLSVLYVWCQLNKDTVVSFWFGTRFKAMYLPWVLFAFNLIISGGGIMELLGILIGHLAFFLIFKYPQEFGGPALLTTPDFLRRWFPDTRYVGGFGSAPAARAPAPAAAGAAAGAGGGLFNRGHNWGRGRALGGN